MSNVLDELNKSGEFTGITFTPGIPPISDPLRFIGWRRVDNVWEIITTGLSEIATKETRDASRSGFGIEFVIRVTARNGETEPPDAWTTKLLQPLGRMVFWSSQIPANGSVMKFDQSQLIDGNEFRVFDEVNPFGTPAHPLDFVNHDGFLARAHNGLRQGRPGHDGPPPQPGRRIWNTPLVWQLNGLGFVNDSTFGVMQTENGPVQWVRCLPLRGDATIETFPADGILDRGNP